MKYVIAIFTLTSFFQLPAQEAPELTGTWEVKEAVLNDQFVYDDQTEQQLLQIAEALRGSRLELHRKGKAAFLTKVPRLRIDKAVWTFNPEQGSIRLTEERDSNVLMELLVFVRDDGLLAYISESPFILNMIKVGED